MFKRIDTMLNNVTMYRLMVYYLGGLLGVAFIVGLFGKVGFNPFALLLSTAVLLGACWGINRAFAALFKVSVNHESSIITALILALIITPAFDQYTIAFLLAASGLAIASKYLLSVGNTHLFNPVAIAVALTAVGAQQTASWWVGTAIMLPFVIIGGLLVIRKTKRYGMLISYVVTTFAATALFSVLGNGDVLTVLKQAALTSPLFFLGFVMLTEPATSPGKKRDQWWYGALVGLLIPPQVHIGSLYTSPEIALIIANAFAYIVSPRLRVFPKLIEKKQVATNSFDIIFAVDKKISYKPGQYMEWTLPHKDIDSRGNRRYFTLASSPTEDTLRLGIKFYEPSSSYKKTLTAITEETPIVAAHVAGDFVMPNNEKQKLTFIAGGIGITPFRSMVKYLVDSHQSRDVLLLYAANTRGDIAYSELFEQARQQFGMATTYVLSKPENEQSLTTYERAGYIDADAITALVPDYKERVFYISGTHQMVVAVHDTLVHLGVPRTHIKSDFFPGYV